MRRRSAPLAAALAALLASLPSCSHAAASFDVVVYGATPAGIAAALAIAREGRSCALVHPLARIGGMMTGGLGMTDVGNVRVIGGLALEVFTRIGAEYNTSAGAPPVFKFEPHVALDVFEALIREANGLVTLATGLTVVSVAKQGVALASISCADTLALEAGGAAAAAALGSPIVYEGSAFIDASYEGDLIALAGVSTAVGREASATYGESLAGRLAVPNSVGGHQFSVAVNATAPGGGELPMLTGPPGPVGGGDAKEQAFNFRLCLTTNKTNQIALTKPDGYDPSYWELFRRYIAAKWPNGTHWSMHDVMNISPLPHEKTDVNNNGAISTDAIGMSWGWATAPPAARAAMFAAHKLYTQSFLWFLASDAAVPPAVRAEVATWGLAADEFTDSQGWPTQLYVREGRRMVSDFVFTQRDREVNRTKPDSIGLFSYNMDTHNSQRFVQIEAGGVAWVRNEGDVEVGGGDGPGQLPWRMIVPRRAEATNLLAPVPASASHIAYGTVRLEPQFLILGQSAGVAAGRLVANGGGAFQDADVPALQARLRALGQLIDMPA
jgi:hypothetical protein